MGHTNGDVVEQELTCCPGSQVQIVQLTETAATCNEGEGNEVECRKVGRQLWISHLPTVAAASAPPAACWCSLQLPALAAEG